MIRDLRRQGHPICSVHEGYYYPISREDAQAGAAYLTHMFQPLREAADGFFRGLDREFGPATLFGREAI